MSYRGGGESTNAGVSLKGGVGSVQITSALPSRPNPARKSGASILRWPRGKTHIFW